MSSLSSAKNSSSKRSSKGNLIQNINQNNLTSQAYNQNRYISEKQKQKQKSAHNSISSSKKKFSTTQKNKFSSLQIPSPYKPYNHNNNLITFQKTQQKLKKNLMKQFQTFNHHQNESDKYLRNYQQGEQVEKSQKSSRSKSKKKSVNNIHSQSHCFKEKSSKNKRYQLQQTTSHKQRAERILAGSKKNSKTQLSNYPNTNNPITLSFSKQKQTIQKSILASGHQSNQNSFTIKSRSKSPILAQQQKLKRSRNSSPDVGRVYNNSKTQHYKEASKRGVYSKMEYYQRNIDQKQQQKHQKNNNKPISHYKKTPQKTPSTIKTPPHFNNQSTSQTKPSSITKTSNQPQQIQSNLNIINFPHMITESQSIYPSSSYPNTGKQSQQNYYDKRNMNRNIEEEEEEEGQEYQEDEEIKDQYNTGGDVDYISESGDVNERFQGEQFSSSNSSIKYSNKRLKLTDYKIQNSSQNNFKTSKGFLKDPSTTFNNYRAQNLPKSFIIAMQTLQNKVQQQSNLIKKLKKSINLKNVAQKQANQKIVNLTTKLQQKQQTIVKKDIQINFLKGYLDQVKQNNRQALRQVAKNVYQKVIEHNTPTKESSSIIKRQRINSQQKRNSSTNSKINKQNKRLFNNENEQTGNKQDMTDTNIKEGGQNQNYLSEQQQQLEINLNNNQILQEQDNKTTDKQLIPNKENNVQNNRKNQNRQFQFQQSFSLQSPQPKPQKLTSSITKKTQKKQQSQKNRSTSQNQPNLPKKNPFSSRHTKSKSIIDQIHPSNSQNNTQKKMTLKRKYDYTNQQQNRDQYLYENNKIKNVIMNRQDRDDELANSDGKRFRVNSERISNGYKDYRYGNNNGARKNVYFGDSLQPQPLNRNFSHSFLKSQRKPIPNSSINNNKPELHDPVLQKYIQSKSLYQLGYSPQINRNNLQTFSISHQPSYQNEQLLSIDPRQKSFMMSKHRDKISKMRDLIRSQKQLVTLNYQMESLENKILNQVNKISKKQKESGRKHLQDFGKNIDTNRSGYNLDGLQYQYNLIKKQFQKKQTEIRRLKIQLDEDGR